MMEPSFTVCAFHVSVLVAEGKLSLSNNFETHGMCIFRKVVKKDSFSFFLYIFPIIEVINKKFSPRKSVSIEIQMEPPTYDQKD